MHVKKAAALRMLAGFPNSNIWLFGGPRRFTSSGVVKSPKRISAKKPTPSWSSECDFTRPSQGFEEMAWSRLQPF